MNTLNLTSSIALARDIASDRHECDLDPLFGPLHGHVVRQCEVASLINSALKGQHNPTSPYMWAVVVDCHAAMTLLDRAEGVESFQNEHATSDVREAAKRKISEAISWLF